MKGGVVMPELKYKRVLLKLSGEAMAGPNGSGVHLETVNQICSQIKEVYELGVQLGIVVGGGNFWRGRTASQMGMDRGTADYIGMMATVMNSIILQESLEKMGVVTRVLTALEIKEVAEPYIRRRALRHLEKGRVVIFGGGTGNPFFSTDTAAALRAAEMGCEAILKATKVNGVYDKDPMQDRDAVKFEKLTYLDVIQKGLKVMDSTAATMSMDNDIPIIVFDLGEQGVIKRAVLGERVGTIVGR